MLGGFTTSTIGGGTRYKPDQARFGAAQVPAQYQRNLQRHPVGCQWNHPHCGAKRLTGAEYWQLLAVISGVRLRGCGGNAPLVARNHARVGLQRMLHLKERPRVSEAGQSWRVAVAAPHSSAKTFGGIRSAESPSPDRGQAPAARKLARIPARIATELLPRDVRATR